MSAIPRVLKVIGLATGIFVLPGLPAHAQGGFFGGWFYSDGSQQYNSRAVAGAAPNRLATGRGVRCEYRYVVRNGQRIRYRYCE